MAERMGACLRETDLVARLGGEESGIILALGDVVLERACRQGVE